MRKLGKKNKISFGIFTVVVVLVIAVFTYGVIRVLSYEKEEYELSAGSVMYDENNSFISLADASIMNLKWNGKYYVTLGDKTSYTLGEEAIIYNSSDYRMYLYGTFYQVFENGKVEKKTGQTEVVKNNNCNFYKLRDRKYLIVANKINTKDLSVNTTNYLIVEIDKIGNALLMNNEINIKTITPTKLNTEAFSFDIANEKLVYGNTTIDLKKINGSTNEYVEPVKTIVNNNNNSNNGSGGTGGTGGTGGSGTIIYGNTGSNSSEIKLVKKVGLNAITPYTTYLSIDYTVIDLNNEYSSVYLLVDDGVEQKRIELNKENSNYKVTNLKPNYEYTISLGYTYVDKSDGFNSVTEKISDVFKVKTLKLSQSLKITKVQKPLKNGTGVVLKEGKLYFNLKLDTNYKLESGSIALYSDSTYIGTISMTEENLRTAITSSGWNSYVTYTELGYQNVLRLENAIYNGSNADVSLSTIYVNS